MNTGNNKKQKRWAILLFVVILLLMCMIMVGILRDAKDWVYANHVNDKITHITFAAFLTFLASYILYPRKLHIFNFEIPFGALILFFLFSFDEASQVLLPGRDADPFDLLASYTGLVIGYLSFRQWKSRKME